MLKIYFKKYFCILFLLLWCISCSAGKIIVLFGTSCAGKSTLGKKLQNNLGAQWQFIDRDDLIEQRIDTCDKSDEEELNFLADEVNKRLCMSNIIIDTNLYADNFVKKLFATNVFRVLVYAPLKLLLERDEQRTQVLQRSAEQVCYAKQFVLNTYEYYYTQDQHVEKKCIGQESGKNIYSRFEFDICVNTQNTSITMIADIVKNKVAI